jgi:PEP-CTERM motif
MMGPLTTFPSRLVASALLALLGAAPASAASSTVYWDREDYGFGAGIGVSQQTATDAAEDGIPILDTVQLGITLDAWDPNDPNTVQVHHDLFKSSLVLPGNGNPATVTSGWDGTNQIPGVNDGIAGDENQTIYVVFAHPTTGQATVNGVTHTYTYDPADVGLTLTFGAGGNDWVILQVPIDSSNDYAYLPAVSLNTLDLDATDAFSLFYSLKNPQVFQGSSIDKLGLPKWELAIATGAAPIPEPSSGLLMFIGLLGIARARRKHA